MKYHFCICFEWVLSQPLKASGQFFWFEAANSFAYRNMVLVILEVNVPLPSGGLWQGSQAWSSLRISYRCTDLGFPPSPAALGVHSVASQLWSSIL